MTKDVRFPPGLGCCARHPGEGVSLPDEGGALASQSSQGPTWGEARCSPTEETPLALWTRKAVTSQMTDS